MTWKTKARARHRLESSLSESRDLDGDGVSPVVDGSGPMRSAVGIPESQPLRFIRADPKKRGRDSKRYLPSATICDGVYFVWYAKSRSALQHPR
jgi:hypothetical protein